MNKREKERERKVSFGIQQKITRNKNHQKIITTIYCVRVASFMCECHVHEFSVSKLLFTKCITAKWPINRFVVPHCIWLKFCWCSFSFFRCVKNDIEKFVLFTIRLILRNGTPKEGREEKRSEEKKTQSWPHSMREVLTLKFTIVCKYQKWWWCSPFIIIIIRKK